MPMIVRRLLLVAVGFVLGGFTVFAWAMEQIGSAEEQVLQSRRQALEKDLYARARFGSYESARCELREYVEFISTICPKLECREPKAVVRGLGLSYARLAVAAEKSGRFKDSESFLGLAKGTLLQAGERPDDKQLLRYWEGIDKAWDDENARVCASSPSVATAVPETTAR